MDQQQPLPIPLLLSLPPQQQQMMNIKIMIQIKSSHPPKQPLFDIFFPPFLLKLVVRIYEQPQPVLQLLLQPQLELLLQLQPFQKSNKNRIINHRMLSSSLQQKFLRKPPICAPPFERYVFVAHGIYYSNLKKVLQKKKR